MAQKHNGSPNRAVRASRKWQKKQQRAGLCPKCGEPSDGYYCKKHKREDRLRKKARRAEIRQANGGQRVKKKMRTDPQKELRTSTVGG